MDTAAPLLEIRDLVVQFPSPSGWLTVVDHVSFSVGHNDVVCVVGESGSGKSVTVQAAVGLVQAKGGRVAGGSVKFAGQELLGLPTRQLNRIRGDAGGMVEARRPTHRLGQGVIGHRPVVAGWRI